jgi:hypothetical protein
MRPSSVALIAILGMGAAGSPDLQRDPRVPTGGTGVIRGRLVAADTLGALQNVTVSLRPADELPAIPHIGGADVFNRPATATARTDLTGEFEFAGIQPGRYRLTVDPGATAARYLPVRFPDPATDESRPLTVSANQVLDQLVIALPRAAVITGQVVDEAGNPMALVSVSAQELQPGDRARLLAGVPGSTTRTDDNGAFRLFGFRPGEYVLSARLMRQGALWIEIGTAATDGQLPLVYYPGTTSAKDATRIRLASGEDHGPIRFVLSPVRLSNIRCLVLDSNGQPAPTVSVSIRSVGLSGAGGMGLSTGSRSTSSDGTLEFTRVPAGEYVLSVSHYAAQGTQFAWAPITVADDVESITLRLQSGVSVKGRVLFDGQPPTPMPAMYVRGQPARAVGGSSSPVLPGPDLLFALSDQFGPTFIRIEGPSGWHLKSVLLGGSDITDRAVEFAADGPTVEVILTQRVAALSGLVTTAAGVPAESSVVLISEDPASWHERATTTKTTMTSGDGKYRLDGLRSGRYLIIATTREDWLVPGSTTDYFELLAKHATRVLVGDGESKGLDLKRVTLR